MNADLVGNSFAGPGFMSWRHMRLGTSKGILTYCTPSNALCFQMPEPRVVVHAMPPATELQVKGWNALPSFKTFERIIRDPVA